MAGTASSNTGKIARHLRRLAWCWSIFGILEAGRTAALIVFAPQINWNWSHSSAVFARWTDLALMMNLLKDRPYSGTPVLGPGFTEWLQTWSAAMVGLSLVAAFALFSRKPWGRTSAIVAALFGLIHPILGTALSIYTLWLLLPANAAVEYRQIARAHESTDSRQPR